MFTYFIGLLSGIMVALVLTFYAFHLRAHHPLSYKGFWYYVGEGVGTPKKAILVCLGLLGGTAMGFGIKRLLRPGSCTELVIAFDLLLLFVSVLAIAIAVQYIRRDREEQ